MLASRAQTPTLYMAGLELQDPTFRFMALLLLPPIVTPQKGFVSHSPTSNFLQSRMYMSHPELRVKHPDEHLDPPHCNCNTFQTETSKPITSPKPQPCTLKPLPAPPSYPSRCRINLKARQPQKEIDCHVPKSPKIGGEVAPQTSGDWHVRGSWTPLKEDPGRLRGPGPLQRCLEPESRNPSSFNRRLAGFSPPPPPERTRAPRERPAGRCFLSLRYVWAGRCR